MCKPKSPASNQLPTLHQSFGLSLYIISFFLTIGSSSGFPSALASEPAKNQPPAEDVEFFERHIRPLLIERCGECHGPEEQMAGLRVDSQAGLLSGGDSGPAITLDRPAASLLMQAVRGTGGLEMPPDEPLKSHEIEQLEHWLKLGAPWPAGEIAPAVEQPARPHWAFQPLRQPPVPTPADPENWIRNPIDAFVLQRLRDNDLAPAATADKATLLRRVAYSLTGLPPSRAQILASATDDSPTAYLRLVEQLLDSPHYGEQQARHWMDLARYSDTKGYVYAREERFWVHAWSYRDWLTRAFNEDLPYNRFLLLQIAADQVNDARPGDAAAMGFMTLGRRFLGSPHDIIDDRIDVLTRGTMGLTVSCARCHDHKYDPIPTADYYSLYGVFASCTERLQPATDNPAPQASADARAAYQQELEKRQRAYQTAFDKSAQASGARVRTRIADYLIAQTQLDQYANNNFDQILQATDLIPAFVRRWADYLHQTKQDNDPIWLAWHAYQQIPAAQFSTDGPRVTTELQNQQLHPTIAKAFQQPPNSFAEVIDRYVAVFSDVEKDWQALVAKAQADQQPAPSELADPKAEQLRQILYGENAPCELPREEIVSSEMFFTSAECTELWKLRGEIDRWIIQSELEIPHALVLVDRQTPSEPRIFRRGNATQPGRHVPRQFLSVLSADEPVPFSEGSGRHELAQAIIDPRNPLTARVFVNRVWTHLIGEGLVATPSDFGTRAGPPSHPQLLDWLAAEFIASGWSVKQLQRLIVTSATFQQSSQRHQPAAQSTLGEQLDPENRLLWRMNPRRLSYEELRDSMLVASAELERAFGGKPTDLFSQPFPRRRAVYGLVDRQFLPGLLRTFDFANPDLHTPQRNETTVPQQALYFLNHPFVLERARKIAADLEPLPPVSRVTGLFQNILQRQPTPQETAEALDWVTTATEEPSREIPQTSAEWSYGYGAIDETQERIVGFTPLPHFTGKAWQGSPQWPDQELGWVQLTASGGHPGNDREHAAIRRWTAPRAMTIKLASKMIHEAPPGDGVRCFIVSSTAGVLASGQPHQQTLQLDVPQLAVQAGETIDFLVDINEVLNSDQYLWEVRIEPTESQQQDQTIIWHSRQDFTHDQISQLSVWEQLAQVLLCANEFSFVD